MMETLIKTIEQLPGLKYTGGVSYDRINEAESLLHLTFAEDYKQYLSTFGQVEASGIELTGISDKKMTSVILLTQQERNNMSIPSSHYVIENIGIDGLIYTQDNTGAIYQLLPNSPIIKVADSLLNYIKSINN